MDNNDKSENKSLDKENVINLSDSNNITPTSVDNNHDMIEKKRDLSAIIPKFEEQTDNANLVELVSRDNELKGDGAVSLGSINSEGEIFLNEGVVIPEPIDIAKRKMEQQRRRTQKNKKKKKMSITAQKVQNSTAVVSLIVIIALAGIIYYIFNRPTEKDFQPLTVTVELGEKLPLRTSSYVKPGVGKEVDELAYALDLSAVNESQPGTYEFTVTFSGIKKKGKVIVQDTTAPSLEVRELIISQGTSYSAASFVQSCADPSGCNYSFQDSATTSKYNSPGTYVVYIVAADAYGNATTKHASLIIEPEGNLRTYRKEVTYDYSLGYESVETYDLRFMNNSGEPVLFYGTHTIEHKYQDENKYNKDRETYAGEVNYTFDDASMKIVYTETNISFVGSNYSKLVDIESYLNREGFSYIGG